MRPPVSVEPAHRCLAAPRPPNQDAGAGEEQHPLTEPSLFHWWQPDFGSCRPGADARKPLVALR